VSHGWKMKNVAKEVSDKDFKQNGVRVQVFHVSARGELALKSHMAGKKHVSLIIEDKT